MVESSQRHDLPRRRPSVLPNSTGFDMTRIIENVGPDILDNISSENSPPTVWYEGNNSNFSEQFLSHQDREKLVKQAKEKLAIGESVGALITAGDKSTQTAHPHVFMLNRASDGISLYFLDPEDAVGKHHMMRPRIVNLLAAKIGEGADFPMTFATLRFRSEEFTSGELTLPVLYPVVADLLQNDGMPKMLSGKEQEIIFRLYSDKNHGVVQARYASENKLRSFLGGERSFGALRGKMKAGHAILSRFVGLVDSPEVFADTFGTSQQEGVAKFEAIRSKFHQTNPLSSVA